MHFYGDTPAVSKPEPNAALESELRVTRRRPRGFIQENTSQ